MFRLLAALLLGGAIGPAQSAQVPDLARGRLELSGLALSASGAATLLRYRPGQTVFYAYQVLNAHPDRDGSIHVEVQATLFHDGPALARQAAATQSIDFEVIE